MVIVLHNAKIATPGPSPLRTNMAARMGNLGRLPLVVILGSTGTGKSKLAIEIGKKVGGEILSADSMQVYKGLDIITNKVTAEELSECPHHLIDFVSPLKDFSVTEFRNLALPLIEDITKRGKIPIIVGGTNYYIESVLWNTLVDEDIGKGSDNSSSEEESSGPAKAMKKRKQIQNDEASNLIHIAKDGFGRKEENAALVKEGDVLKRLHERNDKKYEDIQSSSKDGVSIEMRSEIFSDTGNMFSYSEEKFSNDHEVTTLKDDTNSKKSLYEKLKDVDPAMAARLHPSDSRKIARSLQVYEQHGRQHSQILQEQREQPGGSNYGGPLRFQNMCVFWLQCQREVLNERVDKRVDKMLERGLIDELLDFHGEYQNVLVKKDQKIRYTEGIFQSIGFKEFHEFLVRYKGRKFDESSLSKENKELLWEGIYNMKLVTRRYAKKQVAWVRNRFLARPPHSAPDVYGLDATDLENWEDSVLKNALDILEKVLKGERPVLSPLPRIVIQDDRHARHVCDICDNRLILGEQNWRKHLVSKSHKWHIKREQRKGLQYTEPIA